MSVELVSPRAPAAATGSSTSDAEMPSHGLRVLEARVYRGPSMYAYRRVIRLTLDLGKLEAFPSDELAGFNDGLLQHIPTLESHTCSYGTRGGFVRRLREGTWLGHVIEHIAI